MAVAAKIYFHGMPGSADELAFLDAGACADIWAPDRVRDAPQLQFQEYLTHLELGIRHRFPAGPLHLIGFSLGARMALEMAARLGERVEKIDLVSAAAPLECGVDLNAMAGGRVFRLARDAPRRFALLTTAQHFLSSLSSALTFRLIFSSVKGGDIALAKDPDFRQILERALRTSFSSSRNGYLREMIAYVAPWTEILARVKAPVTLWHGSDDNWSPPQMSDWLASKLQCVAAHHILDGQSHYSTLKRAEL